MTVKYSHLSHSKTRLTVHLIFCVKYRKKLLDRVGERIKRYSREASEGKKFTIFKMEVDEDHIHYMIDFEPSISVGYIAKVLKSQTTQKLWKDGERYLTKHFWKRRVLWSSGYFACTVGDASRSTLEYYIENQG